MHPCYCPVCGDRAEEKTCCWYVDDDDDPHPHLLIPPKPWVEWSADHRFLITLMMERFGGAAEEWELLCRLPWPEWRFESCVCEPWGRWIVSVSDHPCIRDKKEHRTRYFLCELARDAYTAHQREVLEGCQPQGLGTW